MQIQKVFYWKSLTMGTCFRLRFFSRSSEEYCYGKGFKLTLGFSRKLFHLHKEWKDIKVIILGIRIHYKECY